MLQGRLFRVREKFKDFSVQKMAVLHGKEFNKCVLPMNIYTYFVRIK